MRKYETFFILDPDLPDEVNTAVDDKLQSVIGSNGGTVLSCVPWGKRKLAYPVKKRIRGHYVLMEYAGGPELVSELERNMRLDERVLKFITVKLDDRFDPEKEEARRASAASASDEGKEEVPSLESPAPEDVSKEVSEGGAEEDAPEAEEK